MCCSNPFYLCEHNYQWGTAGMIQEECVWNMKKICKKDALVVEYFIRMFNRIRKDQEAIKAIESVPHSGKDWKEKGCK